MKYLSVDIETTGLESDKDQILEFGCVWDDGISEIDDLPTLHTYLYYDRLSGNPFALAMNYKIIERIAKRVPGYSYLHPDSLGSHLYEWLTNKCCITPGQSVLCAGKNFGAFDLQFLKKIQQMPKMKHRFLDPAAYWTIPSDIEPPTLGECCKRAGLGDVPHTAKEDAMLVVKLLRAGRKRFFVG